jgi:hypothetical protein
MSALTARLEEAQQLFESGDVLEAAGVLTQLATEAKGDPQTLAEIARKRREMRARIAPADLFDFEVAAGLRRSGSSAGRVVGGLLAILLLPLYVGIITFVAGYSQPVSNPQKFLLFLAIFGVAAPLGAGLAALAESMSRSPRLRVLAGLLLIAVASFDYYRIADSSYWTGVFPSGPSFSGDVLAYRLVIAGIPALIGLLLLGCGAGDLVRGRRRAGS